MDAISYSYADKAQKRIKRFIENPDSNSGVLTQPKVIEAGETVTIKSGRQAILADTVIDGDLVIEAGADVFVPAGAGFSDLESQIALKADTSYVNDKYSGFKNYIINGNFDIWQYGVSQASHGYGSDDRWFNANGGSTKTHSQIACTDTERVLINASKCSRTVVSSVVGGGNYVVKRTNIEDVTKLAGKTITVSFWAKADSNKNIWLEFTQSFGTGGSPSTAVTGIYGQAIALTSTWQKKTITLTLPSIVGKTLGTDGVHTSSTSVQFWFDVGSVNIARIPTGIQQSGTFDIAQVQLEEGSVATPFENRPYGLELSLCQRYLPSATGFYAGYAATSTEVYLSVAGDVASRVAPTGISYSLGGTVYYTNNSSNITNIIYFGGNINSHTIKIIPTGAPLTIGQGVMVRIPTILFTGCEL